MAVLVKCASCAESLDRHDRVLICDTCANHSNANWRECNEEEIANFLFCGFCFTRPTHLGHTNVIYSQWKSIKDVRSEVVNGNNVSVDIDSICSEMKCAKGDYDKWKEAVSSLTVPVDNLRHADAVVGVIQKHKNALASAFHDCLEPAKTYRKRCHEVSSEMHILKKRIEEGTVGMLPESAEHLSSCTENSEMVGGNCEKKECEEKMKRKDEEVKEMEKQWSDVKHELRETKYELEVERLRNQSVTGSVDVHLERFNCIDGGYLHVAGVPVKSRPARLFIKMSKDVELCAVDVRRMDLNGIRIGSYPVKGVLSINMDHNPVYEQAVSFVLEYETLDGETTVTTQKVAFPSPFKIHGGTWYLLTLWFDKDVDMVSGKDNFSVSELTYPGNRDYRMTMHDCHPTTLQPYLVANTTGGGYAEILETNFPGFHFRF